MDLEKEPGAGAPPPSLRREAKACPRCGQLLFADMDVCYGCLYDFSRDHRAPTLPPVGPARPEGPRVVLADDLDEPSSPEATAVLAKPPAKALVAAGPVSAVFLRTGDVDVVVEVPVGGLRVGRSPDNDVVLHSKAVSREHVAIMPAEEGVVVRDLGSTNPPLFRGRPVVGSVLVPFGSSLLLCGSQLEPRRR